MIARRLTADTFDRVDLSTQGIQRNSPEVTVSQPKVTGNRPEVNVNQPELIENDRK